MAKTDNHKTKDALFLRIGGTEKEILRNQGKQLGMNLTAYCRMVLIQAIKK